MEVKKKINKPPPIPETSDSEGISLSLELATATQPSLTGTLNPLCVVHIDTVELYPFPKRTLHRDREIIRNRTFSNIEVRGAPDNRSALFTFVSYTLILFYLGSLSLDYFPNLRQLFKSRTPTINVAMDQTIPNVQADQIPVVDVSRLSKRNARKIASSDKNRDKTTRTFVSKKTQISSRRAKIRWNIPSKYSKAPIGRDMGGGFFNNTID